MTAFDEQCFDRIEAALDGFRIEIPSWGFANTGTRFGKFIQDGAATSTEEKFADAAEVRRLTGGVSTMALHVLWDLPNGLADVPAIQQLEGHYDVRAGSINPNLFQDQQYKFGSIANPSAEIRKMAANHLLDSVAIGRALKTRDLSLWVSDGSNYPGSQSMRRRIHWVEEALLQTYAALGPDQRILIEYKPFEPFFYHTDLADWGMALLLARTCGPQAKVLVDTGHHYPGTNIEQIICWLLRHDAFGGLHLNDRKYADDDLTLGSIDPYQLFRIFCEIVSSQTERGSFACMIDQSHNLKPKLEAMVQSVVTAQELYARTALIDWDRLAELQDACRITEAEEHFRNAFWTDIRPAVRTWRERRNLPTDPLHALRESGYIEGISRQRSERNRQSAATYA